MRAGDAARAAKANAEFGRDLGVWTGAVCFGLVVMFPWLLIPAGIVFVIFLAWPDRKKDRGADQITVK